MTNFEANGADPAGNPEKPGDALVQLEDLFREQAHPETRGIIRHELLELSEFAQRRQTTRELGFAEGFDEVGRPLGKRVVIQTREEETNGIISNRDVDISLFLESDNEPVRARFSKKLQPESGSSDDSTPWQLAFVPPRMLTHDSPLDDMDSLEGLGLPRVITELIGIARSIPKIHNLFYDLPTDNDHLTETWANIQALLRTYKIPTIAKWNYDATIDGVIHRISVRDVLPDADGLWLSASAAGYTYTTVYREGDFSYYQEYSSGKESETFEDTRAVRDAEADDLTEEQRSRHPYVVLPLDFGGHPSDNEDPRQLATPSSADKQHTIIEPTAADGHRKVGYKVIFAGDIRGSLGLFGVHAFEDAEAAQRWADKQYLREIAEAAPSTGFTEPRATYMLHIIRNLIDYAREANKA